MIDDKYAPTEIRPRYPLPPAPARHLPVAQPDSRYSRGVVVVTMDNTAATFTPHEPRRQHVWTDIEPVAPHPVDVRRPRATSHRAKPITRLWDEHWLFGLACLGVGVVLGALGVGLLGLVSR